MCPKCHSCRSPVLWSVGGTYCAAKLHHVTCDVAWQKQALVTWTIGLSWHFTGENFKKWMLGELSRVISLCGIDSCSKQEHIKGLLFIFTQDSSFSCYSFCIKVIFYCSKFYLVVSCESQSSCRAACGQWTGIYRALSSLTDHLKCFRVQERFIHIQSFFSVHLKHFIHLSSMARFESPTFQA